MAISNEIKYTTLDNLCLDPINPRLGRANTGRHVSQEKILDLMRGWTLDELATSFLESGFWPQEALIVVEEELYGENRLVVVEGNRRLAALVYLRNAFDGKDVPKKFQAIASSAKRPDDLFEKIPYILADSRQDIEIFLGFRHVTGIKEWKPAEKAQYIAMLVDEKGMSYEEVMRKIGSKTDTVRRNHMAFHILGQLEKSDDPMILENVEEKFSVLFLAIREPGVRDFLGINPKASPDDARHPVPEDKSENLDYFATWLFGRDKQSALFSDSRNVGRFAKVLESPRSVQYLKETKNPSFDLAIQKAGADEPELVDRIQRATDEIEQALGRVHLYVESKELQKAVDRLGRGAIELLRKFPTIFDEIVKG